MKIKQFKIFALCTNCDFRGEIIMKKGFRVSLEMCPTCGCKTLLPNIFPKKRSSEAIFGEEAVGVTKRAIKVGEHIIINVKGCKRTSSDVKFYNHE